MSARRFEGPFGAVTQEEADALVAVGATYAHVSALLALRIRATSSGWTFDGAAALARRVGMSPKTMRRSLAWLIAQEVAVQKAPEPRRAGVAGRIAVHGSWSAPRRALPFSQWPRHLRKVTAYPLAHGDHVSPDDTWSTDAGHVVTEPSTRGHGTRHIPESLPERSPELARGACPHGRDWYGVGPGDDTARCQKCPRVAVAS